MKRRTTYSRLKNEFSSFGVCFSLRALRRTSALNNDFSRRHLCQNPPAAGGRLRIKSYREAIRLSKENNELSPLYVSQIYVNLANVYDEMGRTVESIEELKKVENLVNRSPMARANLAIKHLSLSEKVKSRSVMRFLIEKGISELEDICNNMGPNDIPFDILGKV